MDREGGDRGREASRIPILQRKKKLSVPVDQEWSLVHWKSSGFGILYFHYSLQGG